MPLVAFTTTSFNSCVLPMLSVSACASICGDTNRNPKAPKNVFLILYTC